MSARVLFLAIAVSVLLSFSAEWTSAATRANVSPGLQFGVISSSPTANQIAFDRLKRKGTIWDALVAVMFQLLIEAPHIVSLDSDVAMMVVKRGTTPQLYWLSNFDALGREKTTFFPYSRWPAKLIQLHQSVAHSQFGLDDLLSLPYLKAQKGVPVADEFRPDLDQLKKIPFFSQKLSKKPPASPKLANIIKGFENGQVIYLQDEKKQSYLISEKSAHIPSALKNKLKLQMTIPSPHVWIHKASLASGDETLYGGDSEWLAKLQSRRNQMLNPSEDSKEAPVVTYIKKMDIERIKSPYRFTLGMIMFDRYGQLVAINIGIPEIGNGYVDPKTQTYATHAYQSLKERFWALSPYAWGHRLPNRNKPWRLKSVLVPLISRLDAFLSSFPVLLAQSQNKDAKFYDLIEIPQFQKPTAKVLFVSGDPKIYKKAFQKVQSFKAPTRYIGLEVFTHRVIGFTSPEILATPLLH